MTTLTVEARLVASRRRLPPMTRPFSDAADEAVLARAAAGDDDALGELYDRFGGAAFGLALRVLRDRALAEDAVQEAFIAVWRHGGRYSAARGSARTWILTLVHRRAVDLVRRQERRRRRSPIPSRTRLRLEAEPTTRRCRATSAPACRRRSPGFHAISGSRSSSRTTAA